MRPEEKPAESARAHLHDLSLTAEAVPSWHSEIRKKEGWEGAERAVRESLKGLNPEADRSLIFVAQSLKALDIPFHITPVELVSPTTTSLQIGTPAPPFALRYEGQYERFTALLREIDVPLAVRIRNPRELGLADFTPERAQSLHMNDTKLRYPTFFKAVEAAYEESLRATDKIVTTAERLRTERNLAVAERLGEYVDEFNHRRHDLSAVSLRIERQDGEPVILSAGPLNDSPPEHIVLVRRAVLGEFGSFLKAEFFSR